MVSMRRVLEARRCALWLRHRVRVSPLPASGLCEPKRIAALSRGVEGLPDQDATRWQGQQHYAIESKSAWTYWSGTSFAAPIITALAARALQGQSAPFSGEVVRAAIADAGQSITWIGLESDANVEGLMIKATQEWQPSTPERNAQEP